MTNKEFLELAIKDSNIPMVKKLFHLRAANFQHMETFMYDNDTIYLDRKLVEMVVQVIHDKKYKRDVKVTLFRYFYNHKGKKGTSHQIAESKIADDIYSDPSNLVVLSYGNKHSRIGVFTSLIKAKQHAYKLTIGEITDDTINEDDVKNTRFIFEESYNYT